MNGRRDRSWDDFKSVGGEERQRAPTRWERIYTALGTLVIGLVIGYIMAHVLYMFISAFTLRRGLGFFRLPWWVNGLATAFAFGWVFVNWTRGLKEEEETRARIERRRLRAEARQRREAEEALERFSGREEE